MKSFAAIAFMSLGLALPSQVLASPIVLQEFLFNLDGAQYHNSTAVPGLNAGGFDTGTGLGTLVLTLNPGAPGNYFFDAFFNHDLHDPFFNEYGRVNGVAGAGMTWQIDEPQLGSDFNRTGTIFSNTASNALDSINHVPGTKSNFFDDCGANGGGAVDASCNNDVSLALGFNFLLAANQQAVMTLNVGQARPGSGFFLQQLSPADGTPAQAADNLFLTGTLVIGPAGSGPATVPEPASLLLIGTGLMAVARRALRRNREAL